MKHSWKHLYLLLLNFLIRFIQFKDKIFDTLINTRWSTTACEFTKTENSAKYCVKFDYICNSLWFCLIKSDDSDEIVQIKLKIK